MDATTIPKLVQTGPEWFEAGLTYRYQMPDGPGPYPTVVMLHGRFGSEDVMWVFRKAIPRPWFVVAPRAPLVDQGGYSWLYQSYDEWPDLAAFKPAVAALVRFIQALPRLYNADPDRIYLMGFSQGTAVSFATALQHPGLVRGVAGLVGFVPTMTGEAIDGRLTDLPVFMAAGTEDELVPHEVAQQSAELVRHSGANLEYHEYRIGHKVTAAGIEDLRRWFLAL